MAEEAAAGRSGASKAVQAVTIGATVFGLLVFAFGALVGCSDGVKKNSTDLGTKDAAKAGNFAGCFSVEKNAPAQLQFSQQNGQWVMQMKEPDGTWDRPEILLPLNNEQAWQAYRVNAIGLAKSDLAASLMRTDGVLIISQLTTATALNPALDSAFVVNLFGASNTIYPVACDQLPVDLRTSADDLAQFAPH